MLTDLIAKMRNELVSRHDAGYMQRFEDDLGKVAALNDPASIAHLLTFFDDDAAFDEMMFSIVHTIERFDDATYVRAITDHIDSFFSASPRWAIIVHMRILNSPQTFSAYANCVKTLPKDKRDIVRKVIEAVRQKNLKFVSPCNSLLAII